MIAKKITYTKSTPTIREVAEYIAAAEEKGEKLDNLWVMNTSDPEDFEMSIIETHAQQEMNKRVKTSKQYHLVVSFRDEKPDLESLKIIEREYAKALGFEDHPAFIGTHINTDNFHMHMVYSRIHPETYMAHSPSHDFRKLQKVNRAMEKRFGLKIDAKKEQELAQEGKLEIYIDRVRKPQSVLDQEAFTLEESFHSYAERHKSQIVKAINDSKNWQELHEKTAQLTMQFQPSGKGMVLRNLEGNQRMKASALGRDYSAQKLIDRFGEYEAPLAQKSYSEVTPENEELGTNYDEADLQEEHRDLTKLRNENFPAYAKAHEAFIQTAIEESNNWQELHQTLKSAKLQTNLKGNGLIFHALDNKDQQIKASDISRQFSKSKLEEKLGAFEAMETDFAIKEFAHHQIDTMLQSLKEHDNWQDLHHDTMQQGYFLRPQKNGFHLVHSETKETYNLEKINPKLNNQNVLNKFGPYQRYEQNHETYKKILGRKDAIQDAVNQSENWQELHKNLGQQDLQFRKLKYGLHLVDLKENKFIKAENIDAGFTSTTLEEKLGTFEKHIKPSRKYQKPKIQKRNQTLHKNLKKQWPDIRDALNKADHLDDFHHALDKRGLTLTESYGQLYFNNLETEERVPARLIDKDFSLKTLEYGFEKFKPAIKEKNLAQIIETLPEFETNLTDQINMGKVKNWQDLHRFARKNNISLSLKEDELAGQYIRPKGLLRAEQLGTEKTKLSYFTDSFTNAALTEKFGKFEPFVENRRFMARAKSHHQDILKILPEATDWQDFHQKTEKLGLGLRVQKNGLHFVDVTSKEIFKETIKASHINPDLTSERLESHLGKFEKQVKSPELLRWGKENKDDLLLMAQSNKNWRTLHKETTKYGFQFRDQKNGLHIMELKTGDTVLASMIDPRLTSENLSNHLGEYKRNPYAPRQSFGKGPLLRSSALAPSWKRYMGVKKQDNILGRTLRDYLLMDDMKDPYALALLYLHRMILRDLDNLLSPKQSQTKDLAQNLGLDNTKNPTKNLDNGFGL